MRASIVLFATLFCATASHGQENPLFLDAFWKKTHAFRAILHKNGFEPATDWPALKQNPAESLLIVLGKPDPLETLCTNGEMTEFLRAGGGLLFATDNPTADEIRELLGVRVDGRIVESDEPSVCYGGYLNCPRVFESKIPGLPSHPIFAGLTSSSIIATNRPSFLSENRRLARLATLPIEEEKRFGNFVIRRQILTFAAGGAIEGRGRVLVLADHSMFINGMMLRSDNDNIAFAANIAGWLSEGGKRKRALLYENGVASTEFDVNFDEANPPMPPIEMLVPVANRFLDGLQEEDILNRLILKSVNLRTILRTTLFIFTLGLLCWGLFRFMNSQRRTEWFPALAPPKLLKPHDAGWARMPACQLASARDLIDETFRESGIGPADPIEVAGGSWLDRRRWHRKIAWMRAVQSGSLNELRPEELEELAESLRTFRQCYSGGQLQLDAAPPTR